MKRHFVYILIAVTLFSCSKGGDTPPTPPTPTPTEANIAFNIDIDPGASNIFAATGASQAVVVNVSSTLPSAGVTIDVVTKKDLDGTTISSTSTSSTAAKTTLSIDNLVSGVLCTTTVTVTSKSKSTNTVASSFKIARK